MSRFEQAVMIVAAVLGVVILGAVTALSLRLAVEVWR